MSKTRNLSDLLDANGDVKSTALDNVPASDVVNDTTPQLGGNLDTNGNNIQFSDNSSARFGTGSDLTIFHDGVGGGSYINESGTGNLFIKGANIKFENSDSSKTYAFLTDGGGVELKYDNSTKVATTTTGVDVTGNLSVTGNILTSEGSATTPSLQLNDNDTGLFDAGANAIGFTTNGSEKVRIVQGGSVGIGTTNPVQKLHVEGSIYTSGSLYVGGTGSANALDDYEEGTFTPSFSNFTGTVSNADYTKIGNIVHVQMYISSISGGSASDAEITNLPFTCDTNGWSPFIVNGQFNSVGFTYQVLGRVEGGTSKLSFKNNNDNNIHGSDIDSTSFMTMQFTYKTA